jgi:hypothetical protein
MCPFYPDIYTPHHNTTPPRTLTTTYWDMAGGAVIPPQRHWPQFPKRKQKQTTTKTRGSSIPTDFFSGGLEKLGE